MTAGQARQKTAGREGAPAHWTTRHWLRAGMGTALLVLVLLSALGVWAIARATSITDELVDTRSPSLTNSVRLEIALVNQETGIRGYGMTGRTQFLEPYRQGLADEKTAVDKLRHLLAGNAGGLADLATVLDRARTWQQRVATPVSSAPPGTPVRLATDRAAEGKAAFDHLREAMTAQQDHFRQARADAVDDLMAAQRLRNWIFTAIALVIVLMVTAVFEGLRRGVTTPLARLSEDAGHVTRGDFAHHITVRGPADLRHLGADIESMRRRLADELTTSERQRRLLDEQAADLKRSNEELEQFAYIASHDLQEPLRKVSTFTQMLQRRYAGHLDARADQYINYAVDGANRMQVLINDLLAFSRIGRVPHDSEPVDLDALVDTTLDTLSVSIEEAGARVTRDDLPTVTGSSTQLGMLWQNLLSNAVKFRDPDRAPVIHIGVSREDTLLRFTVTDNGIGIEPEYADRVFVIFQRLHTKDRYPGSGIGLAMCKKVVEHHGGTITLEPADGPGTRVSFILPAAEPTRQP
ncbi:MULTISPECIES: sensor histidine kinase [unclassified Streptomyces]|uniref:sensor histidine kinase n=1 Tax=unclassified Streptomyces TaxID=2593676 RepID=UPI000DC5AD0B|nr:sensor histidine kinase [Streptomyces sp. PsTaAH-130]RAJ63588.1 HAMP domain-containing protein [Streptomyces sp. PsTaAH-130]